MHCVVVLRCGLLVTVCWCCGVGRAAVQVACRHDGVILGWSGPHPGCVNDNMIWQRTPLPLPAGATIFGDAAYVGAAHCVPPFKRPRGGELTYEQCRYNRAVPWWRSTIEHMFSSIKHFGVLRDVFRARLNASGLGKARAAFGLLLHVANAYTRTHPRRDLGQSAARLLDVLRAMDEKHARTGEIDGTL